LPWRLIRSDLEALPATLRDFGGLAMMGGPMSANDDLPWIPHMLDLIREAVTARVPVVGHCLGAQLMAKALGGTVSRNPVKEIGWCQVTVADNAEAASWFGADLKSFSAFEWHGDTFTLPQGASALLSSPYCAQQGFALGSHLALQCHVEMDAALVQSWCDTGEQEIAASAGPAVQTVAEIRRDLDARLAALNAVADRLYARWTAGLTG
jgi:GMP synthase-like glutamine amidotransferase